jgi:hypothetical protein
VTVITRSFHPAAHIHRRGSLPHARPSHQEENMSRARQPTCPQGAS